MRRPTTAPPTTPNQAQQHDLSEGHATRVVTEAHFESNEMVLEVGPGLGALTAALLKAGAEVVAVERDPARVAHLKTRFAAPLAEGRLRLITGDALQVSPPLRPRWRVLANPPFNLTAALVRRWLLASQPAPHAIDLVLQREAAHKLTGGDGAQTRSSILARLCGTPNVVRHLPREAVSPPSRVDLAVWSHRRSPDAPEMEDLAAVDHLLDHAFAGPRTMQEALRSLATGTQIRRQASEHGWQPADHPRTLAPEAWLALTHLLMTCGKLGGPARRRRAR